MQKERKMLHKKLQLNKKTAVGFVIPLANVNLVCAKTDIGFIGCGAFDIMALDKFSCPAAKIKGPIADLDDLLNNAVVEINETAKSAGLKIGQTGKQTLEKL